MSHYKVYLETSTETLAEGGYLAHVPALLGCVARAKTKDEAIAKTQDAIAAYLELLRKHNLPAPPVAEAITLDVIETDALTLDPDYRPLSDPELDDLWHTQHRSRERLLELLDTCSHLLDARPEKSWPIRQILAHMAQADLWYASRLEENRFTELLWRLAATRELVMSQLHGLPSAERGRVTKHNGEDWTPRKVARRMLEHEAEHLAQIREILDQLHATGHTSQE
jgi:predicted RNase H-like HicB family nuclease